MKKIVEKIYDNEFVLLISLITNYFLYYGIKKMSSIVFKNIFMI